MCGICKLSVFILIQHSVTGKVTTGWVQEGTGLTVKWN